MTSCWNGQNGKRWLFVIIGLLTSMVGAWAAYQQATNMRQAEDLEAHEVRISVLETRVTDAMTEIRDRLVRIERVLNGH